MGATAALTAACGHGAVVGADPKFAPCREVVALEGGPVPEVRWFGPGQDDEVVRHFEWCRAVGPLLVARPGSPIGQPTGDRPIDSLAILSFNVNLGAASAIALVMVELPFGGARRIAQLARVTGRTRSGRAWSLQVGNLHFDVGPIGPSALSAIRARQARAIAQIVDATGAVIVGGDLNAFSLRGTAESVKILQRAFPQTVQGDSLPTRGPQRLDFLFFRLPRGFETRPYRTLPFDFGSDHRPVMGWVRFAE